MFYCLMAPVLTYFNHKIAYFSRRFQKAASKQYSRARLLSVPDSFKFFFHHLQVQLFLGTSPATAVWRIAFKPGLTRWAPYSRLRFLGER